MYWAKVGGFLQEGEHGVNEQLFEGISGIECKIERGDDFEQIATKYKQITVYLFLLE